MKKRLLTILSCMLMAIGALAEETTETISVTFSNYTAGTSYADNEEHDLGGGLVIYTTDCYFTTELRIYSSKAYNGYVVSNLLPGAITKMTFSAAYASGYKKDKLNVYGSIDGNEWKLIKALSVESTSYKNFSVSPEANLSYRCFKLDVEGENQLRVESMSVTYITDKEDSGSTDPEEPTEPTDPEEPTEPQEPQEPTEPNDGSKSKPYTVAEIWEKAASTTQQGQWIRGTIYGTISNDNELTPNGVVKTNLVIGDATKYVPIKLPDEDIRKNINLKEHPYLLGKELLIKGNIEKYQNKLGLVSPTTYEISYSVAINSYGYASLYLDMAAEVPSSCTAYYCTTEGNEVYLHPVGEIIPDSTGVIFVSDEHNSTCTLTYTTAKNDNEENILAENQLIGFAKDTAVDEDGYAYYALNAKNKQVGFYIPQTATDQTDASAGFIAKAYKAYLQVPEENETISFVIPHRDDETNIAPITQTPEKSVYDLQGRVVNNPTRGIYIQGGRKIIFK